MHSEIESLVRAKIARQGGVATFHDGRVLDLITAVRDSTGDGAWIRAARSELEAYRRRVEGPRYAEPGPRLGRSAADLRAAATLDFATLAGSQGVTSMLTWAGHPLFKTVYDCAIQQMLISELRPRTIVELGSGAGGSAIWMADIAAANGLRPRIVSIDKESVLVDDTRVDFRRGDLFAIASVLPRTELARLPHPWMVVEDAHVNVLEVLRHLDAAVQAGDYLVVEDSYSKRAELRAFLAASPHRYLLDLKYLDLFGENGTCAMDSIFTVAA